MSFRVYRSLDRSVSFFGIKGRFIWVMAVLCVVALVLALVLDCLLSNEFFSFIVFLGLAGGAYMVTVDLQGRYTERNFIKKIGARRMHRYVRMDPSVFRNLRRRDGDELN